MQSRIKTDSVAAKQLAATSNAVPAALQARGCVNFVVYALATLFIEETAMARLTKWGNSPGGIRLPKAIIEAAGLRVGDEINCRLLDSGAILLTPCRGQVPLAVSGTSMSALPRPAEKW